MRFLTTLLLLSVPLVLSGCRSNTTLRCERETALLRAEILDLEDKYYALKSQYESEIGSTGNVVTSGIVGSGIISSSPVIMDSSPILQGDVIYEDQIIDGTVVPGTVVPTTVVPTDGGVYYEGQPVPAIQPTPAGAVPGTIDSNQPSTNQTNEDPDQALILPEDPGLEVSYEGLELDLGDGEVDRLEIVSSATRGKDLDGMPGHDGIELLVKTVNSNGDFVERNGELTVIVIDQLAGEIGKWTFLPDELKLFLSRDELGNMGTLLHLPWTEKIPVSKQVQIRVSMLIGDVEYIATLDLNIEPPTGQSDSPAIVGWAVDDARWVSSASSRPTVQVTPTTRTIQKQPTPAIERPVWKPVR